MPDAGDLIADRNCVRHASVYLLGAVAELLKTEKLVVASRGDEMQRLIKQVTNSQNRTMLLGSEETLGEYGFSPGDVVRKPQLEAAFAGRSATGKARRTPTTIGAAGSGRGTGLMHVSYTFEAPPEAATAWLEGGRRVSEAGKTAMLSAARVSLAELTSVEGVVKRSGSGPAAKEPAHGFAATGTVKVVSTKQAGGTPKLIVTGVVFGVQRKDGEIVGARPEAMTNKAALARAEAAGLEVLSALSELTAEHRATTAERPVAVAPERVAAASEPVVAASEPVVKQKPTAASEPVVKQEPTVAPGPVVKRWSTVKQGGRVVERKPVVERESGTAPKRERLVKPEPVVAPQPVAPTPMVQRGETVIEGRRVVRREPARPERKPTPPAEREPEQKPATATATARESAAATPELPPAKPAPAPVVEPPATPKRQQPKQEQPKQERPKQEQPKQVAPKPARSVPEAKAPSVRAVKPRALKPREVRRSEVRIDDPLNRYRRLLPPKALEEIEKVARTWGEPLANEQRYSKEWLEARLTELGNPFETLNTSAAFLANTYRSEQEKIAERGRQRIEAMSRAKTLGQALERTGTKNGKLEAVLDSEQYKKLRADYKLNEQAVAELRNEWRTSRRAEGAEMDDQHPELWFRDNHGDVIRYVALKRELDTRVALEVAREGERWIVEPPEQVEQTLGRTPDPASTERRQWEDLVRRLAKYEIAPPEGGHSADVTARRDDAIDRWRQRQNLPPLAREAAAADMGVAV